MISISVCRWRSHLMWRVFFTSAVVAVVVRSAMSWCKSGKCGHFGSGGFIIWDISEWVHPKFHLEMSMFMSLKEQHEYHIYSWMLFVLDFFFISWILCLPKVIFFNHCEKWRLWVIELFDLIVFVILKWSRRLFVSGAIADDYYWGYWWCSWWAWRFYFIVLFYAALCTYEK